MSRADFIRGGTSGTVALVAGGTLLATAAGPAAAQSRGDKAILEGAAIAELLVIDFLQRALRSGADLNESVTREVLSDEKRHYRTIAAALDNPPTNVDTSFPEGTFDSARSIAKLGFTLDSAFTRFYIGAVKRFDSTKLQTLAAGLAANEAQHLSVFSDVLGRGLIPLPAIPTGISPRAANRALAPLFTDVDRGSQLTG
ncbi:MAG TPA: ferritin-like domain-containing protein [Solirubrobacteraceae bacterium]|nr:ferritin-like domain-containing protein [Solirubrobacteraceae bacterium]